jgi:hypothetical protein
MSIRAKATAKVSGKVTAKLTAIAVTAAACLLLAPAAMASPAQVTGKQLRSALLPASDFGFAVHNTWTSYRKQLR